MNFIIKFSDNNMCKPLWKVLMIHWLEVKTSVRCADGDKTNPKFAPKSSSERDYHKGELLSHGLVPVMGICRFLTENVVHMCSP